jgi:hypothetical protein
MSVETGKSTGKGAAQVKCVVLRTTDNETFEVEEPVARMSETVSNLLEDMEPNVQEPGKLPTVPLSNVIGKV